MWNKNVIRELQKHGLFQSSAHRARMDELMDCYHKYPFFQPGLAKCMYLSCWDEEHFAVMLDMLNQMKFNKYLGLDYMSENGEMLAKESSAHIYDAYVLRLSCSFLNGTDFDLSKLPDNIEPEGKFIITQALKASDIIDQVAS